MSEPNLRVMIVDDDPKQLELISRSLGAEGFEVVTCSSPIGVTNIIVSFAPHVVLMDVNIPALSGDRLLSISRRYAPPITKFILFSASDEGKLRELARTAGADGWISKSVTGRDLAYRLRTVMAASRQEA